MKLSVFEFSSACFAARLILECPQSPMQRFIEFCPKVLSGRGVKLTTHLHLVSRLVMLGAIAILSPAPSFHAVYLIYALPSKFNKIKFREHFP